jgi:two-component system phosphate regulon sensor histidine kinase PhoR
MTWLWPRVRALALAMAAAAAIGGLAGQTFGAGAVLAAAAAALAAVGLCIADGFRIERLMQWCRVAAESAPPPLPEPWAELADRISRALRGQQASTLEAAQRLQGFLDAIDASPNGVLMLDVEGTIRWANAMAAEHLGLVRELDAGQRLTHLVRSPAIVAYLKQRDFSGPASLAAPDGRTQLALQARAFGDGMTLLITQDITERERADTMRRDFVANVSHELRSPLTVLAGFLEAQHTLPLSAPERERALVLMRQQTDRMQALVRDLLALAQIEGAPRPPNDRWMPLETLWLQLQGDAHALDQGRHGLVFEDCAGVQVDGAEAELYSAFWNLLANALRHTPAGRDIRVSWRQRRDGSGEFGVTDNGPGIAREHLPRLTQRFYRVDPSRSRETGGTGLGLAIVKHVAQRHGGEIEVESTLGVGSCFRVVLPPHRVRTQAVAATHSV